MSTATFTQDTEETESGIFPMLPELEFTASIITVPENSVNEDLASEVSKSDGSMPEGPDADQKVELSMDEIYRRVTAIKSSWSNHERLARKVMGEIRLEQLLDSIDQSKAA